MAKFNVTIYREVDAANERDALAIVEDGLLLAKGDYDVCEAQELDDDDEPETEYMTIIIDPENPWL